MMYSISYPSGTIRDAAGNVVPLDDREQAYLDYVEWLRSGGTPDVTDDPPEYSE